MSVRELVRAGHACFLGLVSSRELDTVTASAREDDEPDGRHGRLLECRNEAGAGLISFQFSCRCASFTSLRHFAISELRYAVSSSGVPPTITEPSAASRCATS